MYEKCIVCVSNASPNVVLDVFELYMKCGMVRDHNCQMWHVTEWAQMWNATHHWLISTDPAWHKACHWLVYPDSASKWHVVVGRSNNNARASNWGFNNVGAQMPSATLLRAFWIVAPVWDIFSSGSNPTCRCSWAWEWASATDTEDPFALSRADCLSSRWQNQGETDHALISEAVNKTLTRQK